MCIITDEIESVNQTNILIAYDNTTKEQLVVYSNQTVNHVRDNYMILPVPSNAVHFINLEKNKTIFKTLENLFKTRHTDGYLSKGYSQDFSANSIKYFDVGSYDVYVVSDIETIKKNFKINEKVLNELSNMYENPLEKNKFSYIMCKLKNDKVEYHPLAYAFKADKNNLFVPTKHLHIHNNNYHDHFSVNIFNNKSHSIFKNIESWDHKIYIYNLKDITYKDNTKLLEHVMNDIKKHTVFNTQELPHIPEFHTQALDVSQLKMSGPFYNDDFIISVK